MANNVRTIDMSDTNLVVNYVIEATMRWPESKKKQLYKDIVACLDDGISVDLEKHGFAVSFNGKFFDVLNRHGLNPVC